MKITTTSEQLLRLVKTVMSTIKRTSSLPILGNVKMTSRHGNSLEVTGSDNELEVTTTDDIGSIKDSVNTTLDGRKLLSILATVSPTEPVTLSSQGTGNICVVVDNGRFNLATLPADDYPVMEVPKNYLATCQVEQFALKALLERVSFAMATTLAFTNLRSALFRLEGNTLLVVCTNGHRLALDSVEVTGIASKLVDVVIPSRTITELIRVLRPSSDMIELRIAERQARFTIGNTELVTKLQEEKFPDFVRVVPTVNNLLAQVQTDHLRTAMQRVAVIASHLSNSVRMVVRSDLAGGVMELHMVNDLNEEASQTIPLDYSGPQIEAGYNIWYWLDALQTMQAPSITLAMGDPTKTGVMLVTQPGKEAYRYVLMPLRL